MSSKVKFLECKDIQYINSLSASLKMEISANKYPSTILPLVLKKLLDDIVVQIGSGSESETLLIRGINV